MYAMILRRRSGCLIVPLTGLVQSYIAVAQSDPKAMASAAREGDQSEVFYDTDPKSWARVLKILPPTYPADALRNGVGGIVDLELLLDTSGKIKQVRSIISTPYNPAFEQAIREVLKHWTFGVPRTDRCIPFETVGDARLTFEVRNGEGVVSLTHRESTRFANLASQRSLKALNLEETERFIRESYPPDARRSGAQAIVDALLTINALTGNVEEIEVTNIATTKGPTKLFHVAAKAGLSKLQYPPYEGRTLPWKKCIEIFYSLSAR